MAATDGQITVAAARWADEGSYLREYVAKHRLPAVVKIIKGAYGGLGVPTLPSPGLQSSALLVSAGNRHKIVAQAVKIKEGRRLVCVGPRLAIPDTYQGFFELLSEEGRAVRCIESVAELARRRPEEGFLVRETIRGIQARVDGGGAAAAAVGAHDGGGGAGSGGAVVQVEGARTIAAGEILVPAGEVMLPGAKGRYLKCFDGAAATSPQQSNANPTSSPSCTSNTTTCILLGLEQKGKFSALAREDNISGVHTARNLLSKRLPLTVRLVYGSAPRGLKSAAHFVPELRLLSVFEEEHVFALPLQQKDAQQTITALPLAAPLKLLRTRNDDQLRGMAEFQRLVERCTRMAGEVADRIQVLDGKLGDSKKSPTAQLPPPPPPIETPARTGYMLRRSASSDSANHRTPTNNGTSNGKHYHHHHQRPKDENRAPVVLTKDYEEIDQIYDYVRGFAPLPKNIRSPFSEPSPSLTSHSSTPTHNTGDYQKPEPPPIETIPTKKLQAEKRNRKAAASSTIRDATTTTTVAPTKLYPPPSTQQHVLVPTPPSHHHHHHHHHHHQLPQHHQLPPGLPKLYMKNGQTQRSRLFRQKSASPMKETPPSPISKSGSPIFNIRYKSLNNLQQAMELDGTLDSSNSGGRASGDSAAMKQPEKRSRKLSRPRSLTNLVWELREYPDISLVTAAVPPVAVALAAPKAGKRPTDADKVRHHHPQHLSHQQQQHLKYLNGHSHRGRGALYL